VLVRQQVRHLRVASPRRHLAAAALAPLSASAGAWFARGIRGGQGADGWERSVPWNMKAGELVNRLESFCVLESDSSCWALFLSTQYKRWAGLSPSLSMAWPTKCALNAQGVRG
jgi:hypothetical protein